MNNLVIIFLLLFQLQTCFAADLPALVDEWDEAEIRLSTEAQLPVIHAPRKLPVQLHKQAGEKKPYQSHLHRPILYQKIYIEKKKAD